MDISIRVSIHDYLNKDGSFCKQAQYGATIRSFGVDDGDDCLAIIPLLLEIRDAVEAKVADINTRIAGTPYPDR